MPALTIARLAASVALARCSTGNVQVMARGKSFTLGRELSKCYRPGLVGPVLVYARTGVFKVPLATLLW